MTTSSLQLLQDNLATIGRLVDVAPGLPDLSDPYEGIGDPGGAFLAAREQLAQIDRAAPLVIVIGFGAGWLLDVMEEERRETRVIALEPDPRQVLLLLTRRSWRHWFESGRLRILTGPGYVGASSLARFVDTADPPPVVLGRPDVDEEAAAGARAVAARMIQDGQANQDARRRFAGRYLLHTLTNLPTIATASNVDALTDTFPGLPAIIVGAGPSLDRTLPELARLASRAIVIAADTALRPLLAGAVTPHLTVALDPGELNALHLAVSPIGQDMWLVGEGSLHPNAFAAHDGRTFVFQVSQHQPWPWLKELGVDKGTLRAWGSVITSAFDLALRMGCDPILFAGLDLAYTNEQTYCRGTAFEPTWQSWVDRGFSLQEVWRGSIESRQVITTTDVHGAAVRTAPHLLAFRDWLVEQIGRDRSRRFVNCTDGGVLYGTGLDLHGLHDVLAERPHIDGHVRTRLALAHAGGTNPVSTRVSLGAALETLARGADRATSRALINAWADFTLGAVNASSIQRAVEYALRRLPVR